MTQGNGVKHTVSAGVVHNILVNMITTASAQLAQKGLEKEGWIIERVQSIIEDNDQLIPGLRDYVDLPWVDQLQAQGAKALIQFAIRKAYSFAQAEKLLPPKAPDAPAPEPTDDDKKVADALGVDTEQLSKFAYSENKPAGGQPPAPDQSGATSGDNTEDDDDDEPDYAAIAAEYKAADSSWYKFPPEPESDSTDTVNKNGLEAAVEYLKTRDDLVYDDAPDPDPLANEANETQQ